MIPKTLCLLLLKKLDLDQIAFFDPQLDGVVWPCPAYIRHRRSRPPPSDIGATRFHLAADGCAYAGCTQGTAIPLHQVVDQRMRFDRDQVFLTATDRAFWGSSRRQSMKRRRRTWTSKDVRTLKKLAKKRTRAATI